jgi:hypothetical protein
MIFRLVRSIANTIRWIKAPQQLWQSLFTKHDLKRIKNLMVDFGHEHIFMMMLAFTCQFIFIFNFICNYFTSNWFYFNNWCKYIYFDYTDLPTRSEDINVSYNVPWVPHLSRHRSQWLMILTYFIEMWSLTLSFSVRWPLTGVLVPLISNMRSPSHRRMISLVPSPKFQRLKHLLSKGPNILAVKFNQGTHTIRLWLGECLVGVDVFYFILFEKVVYFVVLYFILFILN